MGRNRSYRARLTGTESQAEVDQSTLNQTRSLDRGLLLHRLIFWKSTDRSMRASLRRFRLCADKFHSKHRHAARLDRRVLNPGATTRRLSNINEMSGAHCL